MKAGGSPRARVVELRGDPLDVIGAWPADVPLIALCSASAGGWGARNGATWSVLAEPRRIVHGPAILGAMDAGGAREGGLPFAGGWIGWMAYELGAEWEPAARSGVAGVARAREETLGIWYRCDDALLFDHAGGRWWAIGEPPVDGIVRGLGSVAGREDGFAAGPLRSRVGRDGYIAAVQRGVEYIRAGDVYQVNVAHELEGPFEGSARGAFVRMARSAAPALGAYLEVDEGKGGRMAVLSASPEMFLSYSPEDRRIVTRPMKGTRPGGGSEQELSLAEKDRAELNMIIDLMRNDLGRVCEFGSVRVEDPRAIERHGSPELGVLQATGTVSGVVRRGVGKGEILRAVFPGGSVTGAPKIRAMQIIEELEGSQRGVYCGSIGYVSDCGRAQFSVAIRTGVIRGAAAAGGLDRIAAGRLSYRVGAGIVADSDPREEWRETMVKAGAVRGIAGVEEG